MFKKSFLVLFLTFFLISCAGGKQPAIAGGESTDVCLYKLPWPANSVKGVIVTQSQNEGNHSGYSKYAIDFDFQGGEPLVATRSGTISAVHDNETDCGGQDKENLANFVIIDHGDGQYSLYYHLLKGIPVTIGQSVSQGQLVGYVGNSGWSDCKTSPGGGTHLHYQLQSIGTGLGQSIPVCFSDVAGNGIPQRNQKYVSQNQTVSVLGAQVEGYSENQNQGSKGIEGEISFVREVVVGNVLETHFTIRNLQTGTETQKDEVPGWALGYDWSRDGKKMLTSGGGYFNYDEYNGIDDLSKISYLEPQEGYTVRQDATWFYNEGKEYILFSCVFQDGYSQSGGICIADPISGTTSMLAVPGKPDLTTGDVFIYGEPSLSPDGKTLVFLRERYNGSSISVDSLVGLRVETDETWDINTQGKIFISPKISLDGTVAFVAGDGLWLVNTDGANLKHLVEDDFMGAGYIDWSPDGNWIVFSKVDENGNSDIWIVNAKSGQQIQITNTPNANEYFPAWRPNH